VRLAIDLDNQPCLCTIKIDNKWSDRVLAPEFEIGEAAVAEVFPENFLGRRQIAAELAGE
jgi:hypothetical protein